MLLKAAYCNDNLRNCLILYRGNLHLRGAITLNRSPYRVIETPTLANQLTDSQDALKPEPGCALGA